MATERAREAGAAAAVTAGAADSEMRAVLARLIPLSCARSLLVKLELCIWEGIFFLSPARDTRNIGRATARRCEASATTCHTVALPMDNGFGNAGPES